MALSFDDRYSPVTESGCWLWLMGLNSGGYGWMHFSGRSMLAHRVSYLINKGDIPDGLCVCHTCDTPSCVNPSHLFLGTRADNAQDRDRKLRNNQCKGPANGNAKLTEEDVISIRNDKRSNTEIAREYSVGKGNVGLIKSRKTWKHI